MSKTLVFILNYNTPKITDDLYELLLPYCRNDYELYILDNGSDTDKKCRNTTVEIGQNLFFGGGLNVGFQYILKNNQYDSLLFMNSDLIVHPYSFVRDLRDYIINKDFDIVSPSIIQPSREQCFWRQMNQWNSTGIRDTKWIDFQCPMFSRRFIEHLQQFDSELNYGWGPDIFSGYVCEEQNWKVGVVDNVTAVHLNGYTINSNKSIPAISNYNRIAEQNMFRYFNRIGLVDKLHELRQYGANYKYE